MLVCAESARYAPCPPLRGGACTPSAWGTADERCERRRAGPATVRGLIARASDPKRERWLQQVRRTGACRHPVQLRGIVVSGEERVYSTVDEPDGALMVRCGNRREACCPSCAHEYRGDMWQLVYAGLAGGRKGVPEQVAEHPQVFASLTAPSFGAVHSRPDNGQPCRCGQRHEADDPELGAATDPAIRLRRRGAVELARPRAVEPLHHRAGPRGRRTGRTQRARWRKQVRIAFAKVAEFQARGLVHFHAIVRLDGAEDRATAPGMLVSPAELCDAIRKAAGRADLDGDAGDGETIDARFGEQLHTRVLAGAEDGRELNPGQVAAYVAKYSCKASHEQITSRDTDPDRWRERGVPEQLVQMAAAALRLSERCGLRTLGRWVHMLGFRGHFVTKSRRYSITLGELRAARASQEQPPVDAQDGSDTTEVLSVWEYLGSGYLNPGDILVAAGVAASLRAAREALLDLRCGPP
jgi:hypothetical protein